MIRPRMRLGAYVLPGDPTWLRSSLSSYYHLLDDLVVPIPEDGRSWTGATLPVRDCLTAINRVDTRRLMRHISGRWIDRRQPLQAEIAQRQACVNALNGVDWVLQVRTTTRYCRMPAPFSSSCRLRTTPKSRLSNGRCGCCSDV